MRRIATLTLAALACLTLIPSIAQARYRGGDMNLYAYVSARPVNAVDPKGLTPARVDAFFVGFRPMIILPDEPLYEKLPILLLIELGYQHADIWHTSHGMVREGLFGPPGEHISKDKRAPRQPDGEDDMVLTRSHSSTRKLKWGKLSCGKLCSVATDSDIIECLKSKPVPGQYANPNKQMEFGGPTRNCHTDVADAVSGCCLDGYLGFLSSPQPRFYWDDRIVETMLLYEGIRTTVLVFAAREAVLRNLRKFKKWLPKP